MGQGINPDKPSYALIVGAIIVILLLVLVALGR